MTDAAVAELAPVAGTRAACAAVGCAQAGWYRRHRQSPLPPRPEPIPHRDRRQPRALAPAERQAIVDVLHSGRFADAAPAEVWATLLDEGSYLGSVPAFYRVLRERGEVRERRRQATHPATVKPELMASAPNQVWSWDITKLHGPVKWTYYYLYVILDIFSRYVTGWMVATAESAALAEKLISETCHKQQISLGQLAIHADRGSSMTSKPVAFLLADLGITQSHSRPHVSNDNPFSESQFKTMKYRPAFPGQFGSIQDARAHCQVFFPWYNNQHRHSGLGLHTPADVHYGRTPAVRAARASVLAAAYATHPERFVLRPPAPPKLPAAAWINRPQPAPAAGATNETGEPPMPSMTLDAVDAAELAEMLAFLSQWLARDPGRLGPSLEDFVGHPAYGIQHLRDDLDRFVFLLGGSDEEQFLTGDHDQPAEGETNGN